MKAIVVYDSCTGNTKKIASKIAGGLNCGAVFISDIGKHKLEDYALIVIGTPVHALKPTKKIKQFLDKIKNSEKPKSYAVFCTYGAPIFGSHSANHCLSYIEKTLKTKCIGKFKCPGFNCILKTYRSYPKKQNLEKAKEFGKALKKKFIQNQKPK